MGQLAKQVAERPTNSFGANIEKNPKEKCQVIFTRRENVEKEKRIEEDVRDEEEEKKEEEEKDKSKESGDDLNHQNQDHEPVNSGGQKRDTTSLIKGDTVPFDAIKKG